MYWKTFSWLGWLWLPALVLLLGACTESRTSPPPVATPTGARAAVASATAQTAVQTQAPPTAIPTALPPSSTAPAATQAPSGPTATGTPDPAVMAVLAYLDARARSDVTAVTGLSCKSWKSKAVTEAVSFRSMNAKLVDVTCQVSGNADGFTLVGCGGKMVTTYGTESRDWDLSAFVYQVTAEDGQWKMCGYH